MTEKLTLKKLSGELETLRARMQELEQQLEVKLKDSLEKAVDKLESRIESTGQPAQGTSIDANERQRLIEQEAYLIAEQRGFQGGDPAEDWIVAEERVNERLILEGIGTKTAIRTRGVAGRKSGAKKTSAKRTRAKPASRA